MEKQQLIEQAKDKLTPFETGNIIDFIQHMDMKSVMEHPVLIIALVIFAFYAVVRRSRFVLLFLFTVIAIMLLVRYTLTPESVGGELSIGSTLPFIGGGLVIGGVLLYFTFIKHD